MDEQPSRKRRITKRVAWAVVVTTLLCGGYLASFLTLEWMIGRVQRPGITPGSLASAQRLIRIQWVVHGPVLRYSLSESPGGAQLEAVRMWCHFQGRGTHESWGDAMQAVEVRRRHSTDTRSQAPVAPPGPPKRLN
jgi:hypothetical protein